MREVMAAQAPQQGSMRVMRLMAFSVFVVAAVSAPFPAHAQSDRVVPAGAQPGVQK